MTPPAAWSIALHGADLERLEAIAGALDRADPDAFGPAGHAPNVIAAAVSEGLRVLEARAVTVAPGPRVTEAGAWSLLLTPGLADRLGWRLDAPRPPDAAWTAADGSAGLSTGERVTAAIALGMWNGCRSGVDIALLGVLDGPALARLARCFQAIADREPVDVWARRELARGTS